MKIFDLNDHIYSIELRNIIDQILDTSFLKLDDEEKIELFIQLDNYIFHATGQPKLKLKIEHNNKVTYFGHYFHNYDGTFDNEYMGFIIRKEADYSPVNMLLVYLHEKFHQFQFRSIAEWNPDVEENVLRLWLWCADYIDFESSESINYLCNPIESSAIKYQYRQNKCLLKDFIYPKVTNKKIIKELKRRAEDSWITLDINNDLLQETSELIERAKASYSPERRFFRKIDR